MTTLKQEDLRALLNQTGQWCLSIYLPTHRTGPEMRQDPIRFKNLLRAAEDQLLTLGLAEEVAQKSLRPLHQLLADESFWQHQTEGLAVFLDQESLRYYHLPIEPPTLSLVTERFHLKPMLRALSSAGQFYLLTLSQKQARLFTGTRYELHELNAPDWPLSLAETLGEEEFQPQLQARSLGRQGSAQHGHGEASAAAQDRALRFFRQVDARVREQLKHEQAPLVLAGVEYLLPIYRAANTYSHLLPDGISGNPDRMTTADLLQQAWALVHPHHLQSREQAATQYQQLRGTGRTTNRVSEAVTFAAQGRIGTLFVPVGVHRWGSFDAAEYKLEMHDEAQPGDEDLLDLAALQTLAHGGTVYVVQPDQMPDGAMAAALLRY